MRILILCFMAVASIAFSFGRDFGESKIGQTEEVLVINTSTVPVDDVGFGNPFILTDLSADMHDSEEQIPAVPKLREGSTYVPSSVETQEVLPSTTSTTTTTLPNGRCSQWYPIAIEAGWPEEDLNKLGNIIFKESSCIHDIANKTYSYGLTQIEWSAHEGWLESEFGIVEREELYDPYTNLLVAKWLFDYAERSYGCGWQPWYMSGDWC